MAEARSVSSPSSSSELEPDEEEDEDEDEDEEKDEEAAAAADWAANASSRARSAKEEQAKPAAVAGFIPAASFQGAMPGFFFRRGDRGPGYYRDTLSSKAAEFNTDKTLKAQARDERKAETREAVEMRTILMSKKAKNLYDRMQHGIQKRKDSVARLERKRDAAVAVVRDGVKGQR